MPNFKVYIPLQKSNDSELFGLASTTSIDRDGERMSQDALNDMKDEILRNGVNLFADHDHGVFNTLGAIKTAVLDGDQLKVGITLDDPVTNPKVPALLNKLKKGIKIGLSVGGKVTKERTEYDKESNKRVKVIDGVQLYEISCVGIPSNADSFINLPSAISKSMKEARTCERCGKPADNRTLTDDNVKVDLCPACRRIAERDDAEKMCPVCFSKEFKDDTCQSCYAKKE